MASWPVLLTPMTTSSAGNELCVSRCRVTLTWWDELEVYRCRFLLFDDVLWLEAATGAIDPTVVLAAKGTVGVEYATLTFYVDDARMESSETWRTSQFKFVCLLMVGRFPEAEKNLVESPSRIFSNGLTGDIEPVVNEDDTGFPLLPEIGVLVFW